MFDELKAAMSAAGIAPANTPMIADGILRRFRLPGDRPQSKNGYITLFDNGDGSYGASFGSWKHDIKQTWFSGKPRSNLTKEERQEHAQRMEAARAKQAKAQRHRHAAAANKARLLWQRAESAQDNHPYLARKGVRPHGIKQMGSSLLVPVRTATGALSGLQFIDGEGGKKFLTGTAVSGAYHAIGPQPDDVLLLAEGFATAATLFEATRHHCACAFFAGNLKPVALALREKYPTARIIICADADPVGRSAAADAAEAVNGTWTEPDFSEMEQP